MTSNPFEIFLTPALLASTHGVDWPVTLLFSLLLVGLIACLALEEKIHAKKSIIAGSFAVVCLLAGTLCGILSFEEIVVGSHEVNVPTGELSIDFSCPVEIENQDNHSVETTEHLEIVAAGSDTEGEGQDGADHEHDGGDTHTDNGKHQAPSCVARGWASTEHPRLYPGNRLVGDRDYFGVEPVCGHHQ